MGNWLMRSIVCIIISRVSPGRPKMKCKPTFSPAACVRITALTVVCQVWHRLTSWSVVSWLLSAPYSMMTGKRLLSSARRCSNGSGMQSGRVPIIMPTTSGTAAASSYICMSMFMLPCVEVYDWKYARYRIDGYFLAKNFLPSSSCWVTGFAWLP